MSQEPNTTLNRAKPYQLVLFPLNNGATNVYYVLILTYIATFGNTVLGIATVFASFMVTGMRVFDAVTDPIIGALMDKTNGKFGKFRPFMVIGSIIMAASVICLYVFTPFVPASMMWLRYALFIGLYAVWVIGYTFQTSVTRAAQAVLEAKRQTGKVLWLNPIPERKWAYVKSIQTMASLCQMAPCSTLDELARACGRMLK